jgi:uncharacterized membrane protein
VQRHEHETSLHRIEAFSDGVFAIAITLLIIEIGVPVVSGDETLGHELRHEWPGYFAYVLSFVTIGIYWANHNSFFKLFARSNHAFLMLNVIFLMTIAFMPFPTAVLGDYLTNSDERQTAVLFYGLGLVLPATTWLAMWLYGVWRNLIAPDLDPGYVRFSTVQYVFSSLIYLAAMLTAFVSVWVCLGICVGLTALYLLPPRRPVYVGDDDGTP